MFGKIKPLFSFSRLSILLTAFVIMTSCSRIYEDMPRCELWLEFVFDHNMEYADAFKPQVKSVDVFVFGNDDKLLLTKRATADELTIGNSMSLSSDLDFGNYKVLTIGGLSDNFRISDSDGKDLVPGVTTLREFMFALQYQSNKVDFNFPHLYFGEVIEVNYSPGSTGNSIYQVKLVRDTNRFNIVLVNLNGTTYTTDIPYTFEIVAPESGAYSWENEPTDITRPVTYLPYSLTTGETTDILLSAHINMPRLLSRSGLDYKIIIRDTKTLNEVLSYNLMTLLSYTKPGTRPDDTALPFQEYLDRQGEWNLIFCVAENTDEGEDEGAYLSFGIQVGSWIYWLQDFEIVG